MTRVSINKLTNIPCTQTKTNPLLWKTKQIFQILIYNQDCCQTAKFKLK